MYIEPSQGRMVEVVIPSTVPPPHRFARATVDGETVYVGIIAYAHNPDLVNLAVIDHRGRSADLMGIVLQQPDKEAPPRQIYCRWPKHTREHSQYRERPSDMGDTPAKAPEAASGAAEDVSGGPVADRPAATAGVPGSQGG